MIIISKFLSKVKRTFVSRKFAYFCILGVINTFHDAFYSWLAHFILQENVAAVVGYLIALTIGFFINCRFIFKRQPTIRRYIRYGISYLPNFIIYFLVTFITINTMGLPQFWGTVLAALAGGPITFFIIKVYAFGKGSK